MYPYVLAAFVIFCALSGSLYIFNDIKDRELDRADPSKQKRPIASGELPVPHAAISATLLLGLALMASLYISSPFFLVGVSYVVLMFTYNFWLREIVIADVVAISLGFVIRTVAGAVVINVRVSPWLIVVSMLFALFLALGKRRAELIAGKEMLRRYRRVLSEYSLEMVENMMSISAACSIMAYTMYTFLARTPWMMLTIPPVVFGHFKYLQLIHKEKTGEELEIVIKNKALIVAIGLWILLVVLILYDIPSLAFRLAGVF
jgi:4-hydroxybenzoate polyprenyltransferase